MKANIPKPKAWRDLSQAQRDRIEKYCRDVALEAARETTERDGRIMLDIYIKMVCLTLHDAFGFGEKRLTMFLGNHRRLFHRQRKMVQNGTQLEYLDKRMTEIFKKNGFPQEFFDEMLGAVETPTEEKEGVHNDNKMDN
jgi:hypothetical protein